MRIIEKKQYNQINNGTVGFLQKNKILHSMFEIKKQ